MVGKTQPEKMSVTIYPVQDPGVETQMDTSTEADEEAARAMGLED